MLLRGGEFARRNSPLARQNLWLFMRLPRREVRVRDNDEALVRCEVCSMGFEETGVSSGAWAVGSTCLFVLPESESGTFGLEYINRIERNHLQNFNLCKFRTFGALSSSLTLNLQLPLFLVRKAWFPASPVSLHLQQQRGLWSGTASSSYPAPFHLNCGERLDLIDCRIHFIFAAFQVLKVSNTKEIPGSQASGKHKLVDTITDPKLAWVGPKPWGIASTLTNEDPKLYTIVDDKGNGPANWDTYMFVEGKWIYSPYAEDGFAMYEVAFKDLRYRLPFNDFEAEVFGRLKLAPSQLHPNAMAFIRAYQVLCKHLGVEATVPFFFYVFKI
ncbi:hypothetical protein A2U01_0003142 [Trifolium medium]|uniref:Transposase (putative) gypsy type domain-containing protein n=1 Tax=Trifolium medium TaxID=97028 RepID=A0A392M4Z0_9FABA|nr:hypothetical protein [Trifolium medium]